MSKWLGELSKMDMESDKINEINMSGLSGHKKSLYQNLENTPGVTPDITDKPHHPEIDVSSLSGHRGPLYQNLENNPGVTPDKPDISSDEIQSLIDGFEERAAIIEYDGGRTAVEAERIAYLEAFTQTLAKFPHDDRYEHSDDWLEQRIKAIQSWLNSIGLQQPD